MNTALKLGPGDHGRRLTVEEYEAADYRPGYRYELVRGELHVSPQPNPPEDRLVNWLYEKLIDYRRANPEVINYVTARARVFVPGEDTCPEPDLAAYHDYPLDAPLGDARWRDLSPSLVVEVTAGDPSKDFDRNVELYLAVPSVREYWILDIRHDPERPELLARRRRGPRWVLRRFAFRETYQPPHLPGFRITIDPRA